MRSSIRCDIYNPGRNPLRKKKGILNFYIITIKNIPSEWQHSCWASWWKIDLLKSWVLWDFPFMDRKTCFYQYGVNTHDCGFYLFYFFFNLSQIIRVEVWTYWEPNQNQFKSSWFSPTCLHAGVQRLSWVHLKACGILIKHVYIQPNWSMTVHIQYIHC